MKPPFPNSYWLEPDRILCGEYPRDFDDVEDHEGMEAVLKAGIRTFVDLTEEGELKPYTDIALKTARRLGIDCETLAFFRFPIRDVSIPRSPEEMKKILSCIFEAIEDGKMVYVHCWGGRGRTGTVAGCVLSELHRLPGEKALQQLSDRWQSCAKAAFSESPETDQQRSFVRRWKPTLLR